LTGDREGSLDFPSLTTIICSEYVSNPSLWYKAPNLNRLVLVPGQVKDDTSMGTSIAFHKERDYSGTFKSFPLLSEIVIALIALPQGIPTLHRIAIIYKEAKLSWEVHRLFFIAQLKEDPMNCPMALLVGDVIGVIVKLLRRKFEFTVLPRKEFNKGVPIATEVDFCF
jgi:hypothetical protein